MQFALMLSLHFMLLVAFQRSVFCERKQKFKGIFWHITDLHVDQNYSRSGNPNDLCHESSNVTVEDNGLYGNFLCDSPQQLLDISIQALHKFESEPDFIIWTGDNLPHTRNPNPDWPVVLDQIKNITMQLHKAFENVTIYPSIGNHDTFPPNLLYPENYSSVYHDYFEKGGWKYILPESTWSTFKKGGYYSHSLENGLRIISLNTILWYQSNLLVQNETDYFQFEFLKNELENASAAHDKVYIIGHVSPGYYNRIRDSQPSTPLYHLPYLREYLKIIKTFSEVIAGQFFGHIHNDMFQLYYCDTGVPYSSGLLAPSLTPWYSNTKKNINVSIPVNPSVRLIRYNSESMLLLDYEQYFLNLTKANKEKRAEFELLYKFDETYNVNNLSTKSLVDLYERMKNNETLFQIFFKYLTAGKVSVTCDDVCKTAQLCSMAGTSEEEYKLCMRSISGDLVPDGSKNTHTVAYVVSFLCIFIAVAGISLFLYSKKKHWFCHDKKRYTSFSGF